MPLLQPLTRPKSPNSSLLSAKSYDPDANSLRSDQESDSDDDERQARARNSRELRAHDKFSVLLEEEEMDSLVLEARRRQERQRDRRGSSQRSGTGLSMRAPLRLFSGSFSDGSRSRSPGGDKQRRRHESTEDLRGEARKQRRQRRKEKKERLLEKASEGEDGELMFEMEEGGMKEGSSTASSDREGSDELDRRGLRHLADAKQQRRKDRRRWTWIYLAIAAAFAALVFGAWRMSTKTAAFKAQPLVSNGTALFAPTTLIISLDGFRADFLQRELTPRLSTLVKEGVSPLYMNPSFPSVTFPNHFTLATGLYPEAHGVVGNSFWDPKLQEHFFYTDTDVSMQPRWWNGEPFWVSAEKAGIRTAVHMWPGSEAHLGGDMKISFLDQYNGKETLPNKVKRVFEFLDRPGLEDPEAKKEDMRPQLIAAYVPNVDADGHTFGPNSTEIRSTIAEADKMLDDIFIGLEARNLSNIVNVIIVSDHGMATTDVSRMIQMEDLVDLDKIDHVDGWPLVGLRPKDPADLDGIYQSIADKASTNPNFDVYLRDVNMPERYHFTQNDRIAPLWVVPKTGWAIVKKDEFDIAEAKAKNLVYHPRGLHGYDHEHPLMRAIFIARGPAFPHQPGSRVEPFRKSYITYAHPYPTLPPPTLIQKPQCYDRTRPLTKQLEQTENIEVYNILCDSIGLEPAPNNGTLRLPLKPSGLHDDVPAIEVPSDPVTSYTLTSSSSPTATTSSPTSSSPTPAKSLGVDPVLPTSDASSDGGKGGGDESASIWDWAKDEFGKAWTWTAGKAEEVWGKIKGGEEEAGREGASIRN